MALDLIIKQVEKLVWWCFQKIYLYSKLNRRFSMNRYQSKDIKKIRKSKTDEALTYKSKAICFLQENHVITIHEAQAKILSPFLVDKMLTISSTKFGTVIN